MLVIGLITLLVSLGLVVGTKVMAEARRNQMKGMMHGLLGANEEFKAVRGEGNINHTGSFPIKWSSITVGARTAETEFLSIEKFVYACKQVPAAEEMMMAAVRSGSETEAKKIFRDVVGAPGQEEIHDRWGQPLQYYTFNNNSSDNVPDSTSPIFVAAGPDSSFGTDDDITSEGF